MNRLVYDITSKAIKCAIADENNQIILIKTIIPKVIQSDDGFCRNYDVNTFWDNFVELTKSTIKESNIEASTIRYITSSSIRPSCVFVDDDNNPIYIGASFDVRAIDYADEIDELLEQGTGKTFYQVTGHSPSLLFCPARYKWFMENIDEIPRAKNITQYLPMDSWILMKFGAEPHANFTSAVESGFFDIEEKIWHPAWKDILNLPEYFFPWPVQSGEVVGNVSPEIQKLFGLSSETELVAGIPDTQAALLGAGLIDPDITAAVIGSTTPVQKIINSYLLNDKEGTWTTVISCKNICDNYILEANTGITGQIISWAANIFADDNNSSMKDRFQNLDRRFIRFDDEEDKIPISSLIDNSVFAFLGPSGLASTKTSITPGIFQFNSPGGMEEMSTSQDSFIGSVFDNIQFAVCENIDILDQIMGKKSESYGILGGVSRNQRFCQRFSDLLKIPIVTSINPETTINGLLMLCDIAAGKIKSKQDLQTILSQKKQNIQLQPRYERFEKMNLKKNEWKKNLEKYS